MFRRESYENYLIPCIIEGIYFELIRLLEAAVDRKFQLPTCDVKVFYGKGYKFIKEIDKGFGNDVTFKFNTFHGSLLLQEISVKGIKRVYNKNGWCPVQADPLSADEITTVIAEIKKLIP